MRRKEATDASSQRRAELSTIKGSRSCSHNSKYKARTPRLSEGEVEGITRNLAHSFLTMDKAGMSRPKNPEAATAQLAAYLLNYPPPPNDPCAGQHQMALGIIGNKIIPPAPATPAKHQKPTTGKSPHSGNSRRQDAIDDITQKKVDKARHQGANRAGF